MLKKEIYSHIPHNVNGLQSNFVAIILDSNSSHRMSMKYEEHSALEVSF